MRALLLAGVASIAFGLATAPAQAQFWRVLSPTIDTCYDVGDGDNDALITQCLHNENDDGDDNFQLIVQKAKLKLKGVDADEVEDVDTRITQLGHNENDDGDYNKQVIVQSAKVKENSYRDDGELSDDTIVFQVAQNENDDGDNNTQIGVQSASADITYD